MLNVNFPLPAELNKEWVEEDIKSFLCSRNSEDIHFECKAFLHFDWKLKCLIDRNLVENPFHSKKPANSILAYRVIESIIAFANREGGLLLLGVGEAKKNTDLPVFDGVPVKSRSGELNFLITGIESDGIGFLEGQFDEDTYKRELGDILFPKGKASKNILKKEKKRKKIFRSNFRLHTVKIWLSKSS